MVLLAIVMDFKRYAYFAGIRRACGVGLLVW